MPHGQVISEPQAQGYPNHVPYSDPGTPDIRDPRHYLWWLVVSQRRRIALGTVWGSLWMCALMLPPYFLARAIDDGLRPRNTGVLVAWTVATLALGVVIAVLGLLRHRTMTLIRIDAAYRTVQVIARQAVRLGATLPRTISVGELSYLQAGDIGRIAQTLTITGPGVGAVIAYAATAILLFDISPLLGAVVVLGVPLLAIAIGPLLGKLHTAEGTYREKQGDLTARAGDIVTGLGVLTGIGGKTQFGRRYRDRSQDLLTDGYRVAGFTSWVQAIGSCLPVLFLGAITWISARMAADSAITVGDMVAVYGYVAALLVPVSSFIEGADDLPRGLVAARRVIGVLAADPDVDDVPGSSVAPPPGPAELRDPASGFRLPVGGLTALVGNRPEQLRALVDRLGRYVESDVTWGPVQLVDVPIADVRRRILVADDDAYLFGGPVRDAVAARAGQPIKEIEKALWTAVATDVVDAMPEGLGSRLAATGRNVSGGQRQRLRLVRALLAEPEVLVLVEPTSALDAHTEATVAARVVTERGRCTTAVVTTSPMWLGHADAVCYLVDGRVEAVGTHSELLASQPGYRALVFRGDLDDPVAPSAAGSTARAGAQR